MKTDHHQLTSRLLDALPQSILLADAAGAIVMRNSAARAALPDGESLDTALLSDGASAVDLDTARAAIAQGAADLVQRDVRILGRGERQLTVDIHVRPWSDTGSPAADGSSGWLVIVDDVARRVSMERRLAAEERSAAAGRLAARVAHELNNPLDGVLRYIGLAERVAGKKAEAYLAGARKGLLRMAEIIRELRGRDTIGGLGGERCSVEQLLEEAITAMQPRAQALGVAVICDETANAHARTVSGVFQVFCNVIKNALDAMAEGGLLRIRLRCTSEQCLIEFADAGCGLQCQDPEQAFEPFYTTKPAGEGSGLGLAICRDILSRLGGTISAASRDDGGTVVTVRLPLYQTDQLTDQEQSRDGNG